MKTIVQNLAIEYADEGSGPVILMLHGWADNLHTFDNLARELSEYRIVRLDLPGFGNSERAKETWGVGEYSEFVAAFCKKLQLEKHVLVGHSFGGRVAIKGVGTDALRPSKLILIASAGITKPKNIKSLLLRAAGVGGRALTSLWPLSLWRQALRRKLYERIGSDYFAAGSMRDIFLKVVSEDLLQYARNISVPSLLIWGRDDTFTPLSHGQRIHRAIRGSRLEILEHATHFVHQEKAFEVAQLIKQFV